MPRILFWFAAMMWFAATPLHAEGAITILTGPKTGTYYAFAGDIALAAERAGLAVKVESSEGSTDNIKRLSSSIVPTLGIVQSDVLGFLRRSKNPDSIEMASRLRMAFPFYDEEVHVLARGGIAQFADLAGRRVAIGEDGSGHMLTAVNLFSIMGVAPLEMRNLSPEEGVVAVLRGELDAVIFVGGKPVRLFKNMEELNLPENAEYADMLGQVHFLPLDDPKILAEYKPARITSADYRFVTADVPTVSVQALMVSDDFSKEKSACENLSRLAGVLRQALPELRKNGHPKWKEVSLATTSIAWKPDRCAVATEAPKPVAKPAASKPKHTSPRKKQEPRRHSGVTRRYYNDRYRY